METLEIIVIVAMLCMTGLVGLGIYLANQRALDRMKEEGLNYRQELRASNLSSSHSGDDGDVITQLITLVQQNPQLLQQFGALMQQGGNQSPPKL